METAWRQNSTTKEVTIDLIYIVKMTTDVLQPCRARPCILGYISLFLSPCWNRITSLRMEASCKQRCNVVEQTPSRLRVEAHFVCSIYQSKADNEIYEWNKGSHRLWVNNRSQRRRNSLSYLILFKGTKRVEKQPARIKKGFPTDASKRAPKISELPLRRCWAMQEKAGKNSFSNKMWSVR